MQRIMYSMLKGIPATWRDEEFLEDLQNLKKTHLVDARPSFCGKTYSLEFCKKQYDIHNCNKVVFIGDSFQLPPVQDDFSPALSQKYLNQTFNLTFGGYELTQVMRQNNGSSILTLATQLRSLMMEGVTKSKVNIQREKNAKAALKKYMSLFDPSVINNVTAICSTNKDVDFWNRMIRQKLNLSSSILAKNDLVVTQTSTFNKAGNWVYNGEYGKILGLDNTIETYADLSFVDADIEIQQHDGSSKIITSKVLVESLATTYGRLTPEKEIHLIAQVMKNNKLYRQTQNIADDKYLSALRLRHAYATTCHKAQGGEWENVLIHPWSIGNNLQWTYTAITRAKKEIFSYAA